MPEKSHLDHPVNDVNKMVSNSNNFFIYTKIGVRTQNDNHLTVINKKPLRRGVMATELSLRNGSRCKPIWYLSIFPL